jgi:acetoin utilization deacetylase AcuC-like enzyme
MLLVLSSPRFERHVTPPGHPERIERAHVFEAVASRWLERGGVVSVPKPAVREDLARVHDPDYIERIATTRGHAVMLDPDTFTSPDSYEIALLAAGAAIQAADHVRTTGSPAFALVRPPGHHAERDRAMGFCLFNNVAVAAAAMLARGVRRVAVVDIDVHHGNGTQAMFYDEPRVLYVSTHQHPFYPGTGAEQEVGGGAGAGFTVNVPMEAGSGDADHHYVYSAIVLPVLKEFDPELTIVSAGFDAHERDPLASMRVTTAGYAGVVRALCDAVGRERVAFVTEGGYNLEALADCLEAAMGILDGASAGDGGAGSREPARGTRAAQRAGEALAPYWKGLAHFRRRQ